MARVFNNAVRLHAMPLEDKSWKLLVWMRSPSAQHIYIRHYFLLEPHTWSGLPKEFHRDGKGNLFLTKLNKCLGILHTGWSSGHTPPELTPFIGNNAEAESEACKGSKQDISSITLPSGSFPGRWVFTLFIRLTTDPREKKKKRQGYLYPWCFPTKCVVLATSTISSSSECTWIESYTHRCQGI